METQVLHHVSVWLDDLSSADSAFTEALEWAWRLGLPIRAVVTSTRLGNCELAPRMHGAEVPPPALSPREGEGRLRGVEDRESAPIVEKVKNWGIACAQRGVTMETSFWVGEIDRGIDQFLRPWDLCVLEGNRSDPAREKLLAKCTRHAKAPLLLAPPVYKPMTRVLILQDHQNPNPAFLRTAARLCLALEVRPLILTMASSERQARLKQSFAEGVCSSLHVQADFDSVVAFNFRIAAARVAAWRNCSHVIVERPNSTSLWQRLRGDAFWQHLGDVFSELKSLAGLVTLLGLPEALVLEVPHKVRDNHFTHTSRRESDVENQRSEAHLISDSNGSALSY
jgi:hypothetical protein